MSSAAGGKRKARTALSQLESHLKGPKDELQSMLYPTEGRVDYEKLKKLLKSAGEKDTDKLSKSQVTRLVERKLKEKKLTMNQIRKALGRPGRDDTEDEEEDEEVAAKKGPARKKAKTTPEAQRASGFFGGIVNAILSPVASIFSPSKKR